MKMIKFAEKVSCIFMLGVCLSANVAGAKELLIVNPTAHAQEGWVEMKTVPLAPYEAKVIDPDKIAAGKDGLTIKEDAQGFTVENRHYKALFVKPGYVLKKLTDKAKNREFEMSGASMILEGDAEIEQFTITQDGAKDAQLKIIRQSPDLIECAITWQDNVAAVEENIRFGTGRLIEFSYQLAYEKPLAQACILFSGVCSGNSLGYQPDALIYPEKERMSGYYPGNQYYTGVPGYAFAYAPSWQSGYGIAIRENVPGRRLSRCLRGQPENDGPQTVMAYYTRNLHGSELPGKQAFNLTLLAGGGPEEAARLAGQSLEPYQVMAPADMYVEQATMGKTLVGRENKVMLKIVSRSAQPLEAPLTAKIGTEEIGKQSVKVGAGQTATVEFKWRQTALETPGNKLEVQLGSQLFRYDLETVKPVEVTRVWPTKVVYRRREPGETEIVMKNNSGQPENVDLALELVTDIDRVVEASKTSYTLAPGETKKVTVAWDNKTVNWGFEVRARLLQQGREIDQKSEFSSAADKFTQCGQMSGLCVPHIYRRGMAKQWMGHLRENYVGYIETYCWQPDEIYNITPKEDVFMSHTESGYREPIEKEALKELVELGKPVGVHVMTHQSTFCPLEGMLDHPEERVFTPDGQIALYSGKMLEGKNGSRTREVLARSNLYSEERFKRYVNNMIASVKMFGWEGVRFDCGFMPTFPQDPRESEKSIYAGEGFDFQGRKLSELFPNDKTGAKLMKMWREEMKAACPDFENIYNTGYATALAYVLPESFEEYKRCDGALFEVMLDTRSKGHNTWQGYADVGVANTQLIREYGCQPSVGSQLGYVPGSVGQRVLQHILFASGLRLYGNCGGPRGSIDDTWKRSRFALRYAEYLYEPKFKPVDLNRRKLELAGDGVERVLWRPFVYERKNADGRQELAVHLVNLPKSDKIWDRHENPPVRKNLKLTVVLMAGEKCGKVSYLLPEPVPHAETLTYDQAGNKLTVNIPELDSAGIVVIGILVP